MRGTITTFIIFVVVLVLGAYAFELSREEKAPSADIFMQQVQFAEDTIPEGSILYTNEAYVFSLAYPENLQVKEHDEEAGSRTISFEDAKGKGFQIFVLPYKDTSITSSRIAKDTRGTAKGVPQEVVIGSGIRALLFKSSDPLLGSLVEVWFLQNGFLYEVTGYAGEEALLARVLATFKPLK